MLEDEKILGTAHVAFGASAAIGGIVQVPVHLDASCSARPSTVDGTEVVREGEFVVSRLMLLSAPNFSEGRDPARIAALARRPRRHVRILDRHSDRDHHRTVFTIAGEWRPLAEALTDAAAAAIEQIDMTRHIGLHPCVGALDVCPFVYIRAEDRAAAERGARNAGSAIAELGIPVFLYGDLAATEERRERAFFRSGGLAELGRRMADAQLSPDFGPDRPSPDGRRHPGHRPPAARRLQRRARHARPGRRPARSPPSCARRAAACPACARSACRWRAAAPRSRPTSTTRSPSPSATSSSVCASWAPPHGTRPVEAELVGLAPAAALEGFPNDVPLRDFDPEQHLIEKRLAGPLSGDPRAII